MKGLLLPLSPTTEPLENYACNIIFAVKITHIIASPGKMRPHPLARDGAALGHCNWKAGIGYIGLLSPHGIGARVDGDI